MDKTAEKSVPLTLFDRPFVAGETFFRTHHKYPVWRQHGVDRWVMNMTVSGRARINHGSAEFTAVPGMLLLFPPGVIHDYAAVDGGDWIHLWCYFTPRADWLRLMQWPEASLGVMRLDAGENAAHIEEIFRKIKNLYDSRCLNHVDFCMNALEELLLWTNALCPRRELERDERLSRLTGWLVEHLDRRLKVEDMAHYCHMSPSRFAHWFKAGQGIAPMRYFESLRMERACELLNCTGMTISEVSSAVGYDDPLHFSRIFRRHSGVPPRTFRLNGAGDK